MATDIEARRVSDVVTRIKWWAAEFKTHSAQETFWWVFRHLDGSKKSIQNNIWICAAKYSMLSVSNALI